MKVCSKCNCRLSWYACTCSRCEAKKCEKWNLVYGDAVKITGGFYRGQSGKAVRMVKEEIPLYSGGSYISKSYKINVEGISRLVLVAYGDAEKQ